MSIRWFRSATFPAPAAHEAGLNVHADLFLVECDQSVRPEAEIEEIAWVAANVLPDFPLAPLTGRSCCRCIIVCVALKELLVMAWAN